MKENYNNRGFVNFIDMRALIHDLKLLGSIAVKAINWVVAQLMCITILGIALLKFTLENAIVSFGFYWKAVCVAWEYACGHIFPVIAKFFVWALGKIMGHLSNLRSKAAAAEEWRMSMHFNQWDMIRYGVEIEKLTLNTPMIEDSTVTV